MSEHDRNAGKTQLDKQPLGSSAEATDSGQKVFAYDTGGVP